MVEEVIVCKHCGKPIEDGQGWHTLAEMHYDCYEQKFGRPKPREILKVEPAYTAPKFEGFKLARAAGGHLVHVVDGATGRSLCGHEPQNNSWRMRARGKWNFVPDNWQPPDRATWFCRKCDAKRPAPAEMASLDAVIERCVGGPR